MTHSSTPRRTQIVVACLLMLAVGSVFMAAIVGWRDFSSYNKRLANWKTEVVDRLGNKTVFQYDALGRRLQITDPNGHTSDYTYDSNGNRLTITDPLGNTTTYSYDSLNRLTTPRYNYSTSSDSLHKGLQGISVHTWLLLGVERAQLENSKASKLISERDYRRQLDELRGLEAAILKEYPRDEFAINDYSLENLIGSTRQATTDTAITTASRPFATQVTNAAAPANKSAGDPPIPAPVETPNPFSPAFWVSFWTALIAGIAAASTVALGWRADKRAVHELRLKIAESGQPKQE